MGFFDKFKSANKSTPVSGKPVSVGDFIYPISASSSLVWGSNELKYLLDYLEVPEVAAIINIKARAFSSMKLEIVSKSTNLPVNNNDPLVRTLRHPNYFQSLKEFLMQTKLFQEIFGNEVLFFLKPIGMGVKSMFTLPPIMVDIDEMSREPFWLSSDFSDKVKYYIDWDGRRIPLDNDDIIHINNSKVKVQPDNVFWGESPMKPLQAPIANIRAAYEARNVLIENRGALGILSNNNSDAVGNSVPFLGPEKEQLQQDYKKYGITKDKWQLIITSLNLKWQQMSIDVDKLKLFEEAKAATEQICDAYGVPFELLANQKGSTFDNQKNAEKRFYTGTIIPEAQEWVDALNRRFETMNKSWEIRASFENLDIFRDNQKDRAQSISMLINGLSKAFQDGAITLEEYKAELQKLKIGV